LDVTLEGKVAIITGGSRGIGQGIAEEFLMSGARAVVVTTRRQENADAACEAIKQSVGADNAARLQAVVARAELADDAHTTVAAVVAEHGSCDILVNNAGTNPAPGHMGEVELAAVDKTWLVNQRGPLAWAQAAWQGWMKEHGGVIINTASVGGLMPGPYIGAYNVSKAALIHLTRQMAMDMAPTVRVNAVAPAVVKTRLSEMLWSTNEQAAIDQHPLKRLGTPGDVANAVTFLASDRASWITGITMPIDGGVSGCGGGG